MEIQNQRQKRLLAEINQLAVHPPCHSLSQLLGARLLSLLLNRIFPALHLQPTLDNPLSKGTRIINLSETLRQLQRIGVLPREFQGLSAYQLIQPQIFLNFVEWVNSQYSLKAQEPNFLMEVLRKNVGADLFYINQLQVDDSSLPVHQQQIPIRNAKVIKPGQTQSNKCLFNTVKKNQSQFKQQKAQVEQSAMMIKSQQLIRKFPPKPIKVSQEKQFSTVKIQSFVNNPIDFVNYSNTTTCKETNRSRRNDSEESSRKQRLDSLKKNIKDLDMKIGKQTQGDALSMKNVVQSKYPQVSSSAKKNIQAWLKSFKFSRPISRALIYDLEDGKLLAELAAYENKDAIKGIITPKKQNDKVLNFKKILDYCKSQHIPVRVVQPRDLLNQSTIWIFLQDLWLFKNKKGFKKPVPVQIPSARKRNTSILQVQSKLCDMPQPLAKLPPKPINISDILGNPPKKACRDQSVNDRESVQSREASYYIHSVSRKKYSQTPSKKNSQLNNSSFFYSRRNSSSKKQQIRQNSLHSSFSPRIQLSKQSYQRVKDYINKNHPKLPQGRQLFSDPLRNGLLLYKIIEKIFALEQFDFSLKPKSIQSVRNNYQYLLSQLERNMSGLFRQFNTDLCLREGKNATYKLIDLLLFNSPLELLDWSQSKFGEQWSSLMDKITNGLKLYEMVQILTGIKLKPIHSSPKSRSQCVANYEKLFSQLLKRGVLKRGFRAAQIVKQNMLQIKELLIEFRQLQGPKSHQVVSPVNILNDLYGFQEISNRLEQDKIKKAVMLKQQSFFQDPNQSSHLIMKSWLISIGFKESASKIQFSNQSDKQLATGVLLLKLIEKFQRKEFKGVCYQNLNKGKSLNNIKTALNFLRLKAKLDPQLLIHEEKYIEGNGKAFYELFVGLKKLYRYNKLS